MSKRCDKLNVNSLLYNSATIEKGNTKNELTSFTKGKAYNNKFIGINKNQIKLNELHSISGGIIVL